MADKEKKETTTIRVTNNVINNCIDVAKELGNPFTFNSVVELAMKLITKERIIFYLKNQK